jgi:hypothetical protein
MTSKSNKRNNPRDGFWEWELVWEARCFNNGDDENPMWLACLTCSWTDLFLARKIFHHEPKTAQLWDLFVQAMEHPESSEPHRPKRLMIDSRHSRGWEVLKGQLNELGIALRKTKNLSYPDGFPEWIERSYFK